MVREGFIEEVMSWNLREGEEGVFWVRGYVWLFSRRVYRARREEGIVRLIDGRLVCLRVWRFGG